MFHIVSVFDVEKHYRTRFGGTVAALRGVTLQVRQGEVYGLLGPNGAGKTTTLRILLGLLRPTAGRIVAFGQENPGDSLREHLSYVPENAAFPEFLTVYGVLNTVTVLRGVPAAQRGDVVESLLEEVQLHQVASQTGRELSRGQRQRLALACALVGRPKVLIMDEPTSGFDPIARAWFKDYLVRLRQRGLTMMISSHLLNEVQEYCDRVAILHAGKIVVEDTVAEVIARAARRTGRGDIQTLESAFMAFVEEQTGGEDTHPGADHRG